MTRVAATLMFIVVLVQSCGEKPGTDEVYLRLDTASATAAAKIFGDRLRYLGEAKPGEVLFQANEMDVVELSAFMHEAAGRCGGFFAATSQDDFIDNSWLLEQSHSYSIDQHELVEDLIARVSASSIVATIDHLSTYHNRFFQAQTGVDSQHWVYDLWQRYGIGLEGFDVTIEGHENWPQPSVVARWQGHTYPDEVIVIGGHGDSISGFFGQVTNRAPGADDNASGIATISEVIRILGASGFRPARTIQFMSYAAEEVGLRGSQEIARAYREQAKNVIAVMQLDMTNFAGSGENSATFIRDFTNDRLTDFTVSLYETYIGGTVINDTCGYACSDHASWHRQGFPAVFPFEARSNQMNRNIHTPRDTLENSDADGNHAGMFARLAVAFAVETAKPAP